MEQAELDWTRDHARRNDPGTSKDAAASMAGGGARAQAKALYWVLATDREGGLTAEEAGLRCGLDNVQSCRRLADLKRAGMVEPTGERRTNGSGRSARVWRVRGVV